MSISGGSGFRRQNEAKADFSEIYTAPTPHAYLGQMANLGYQIGEQAKPYCAAAAEFLSTHNDGDEPVRMLDVGCSYGVASALVKYGCNLEELLAFFSGRAPQSTEACVRSTARWLHAVPPERDLEVIGLDSSAPAIAFGEASGLLSDGIARDFERPSEEPTPAEREVLRRSNLLVSTGAVGYVTERTFAHILGHLGRDHSGQVGPVAVLTVLRMFDTVPIVRCFERAGFRLEALPEVFLPQRAFASPREQREIVSLLEERDIDTDGLESRGVLFAEVFLAARPRSFEAYRDFLRRATIGDTEPPLLATHVEVALAGSS